MNSCGMCLGFEAGGLEKLWNRPLLESPNFVVLPSLGALVEGWLLLLPRDHVLCMGALSEKLAAEMQEVKRLIYLTLQQAYDNIWAFEHGPSRENTSLGCGVDHAHLHLVPVEFDLQNAVTPFLPCGVTWSEGSLEECRDAFVRGEDYLYLQRPNNMGCIATHPGFGSQLFRRAIAQEVGRPHEFDWRKYPQLPNVTLTAEKVRSLTARVPSCQNRIEIAA